jgi:hypothetical protein
MVSGSSPRISAASDAESASIAAITVSTFGAIHIAPRSR